MATLQETVKKEIALFNRSGAISIHQVSLLGEKSLSFHSFEQALDELGLTNTDDFSLDIPDGVIHPMTEKGWELLEEIWANPNGFILKVNTQNAAFAKVLFKGLIDVQHDQPKIKKEKAINALEREYAGYGKGRWE